MVWFDLKAVEVRLVSTVDERRRWDALVAGHHYLPYYRLFGKALRHVAVHGETWLALVGWQAGAFKVGVRDRWIGWSRRQQFARLHLIANNTRYVLLQAEPPKNLASRVLALSLRRLSADMLAVHGYPVWLAETFVDPARFAGTCYRAANWRHLGTTRGFARRSGTAATWHYHGQPKEVFVFSLTDHVQDQLCGETVPDNGQVQPQHTETATVTALQTLHDHLTGMTDFRKPRGQRYSLACVFTLIIAARLSGVRGVSAFAQYAELLSPEQLRAGGAFWSPSKQRYTVPATSTFHWFLSNLPAESLDAVVYDWLQSQSDGQAALAVDGKTIRNASRQRAPDKQIMVAAMEHGSGLVLAQNQVGPDTNEITAVRELVAQLDVQARVVTMDAMHTQVETARLLRQHGADYVMTAVKNNQRTVRDDLASINWCAAEHFSTGPQKAHGRLEERHCYLLDISGTEWDGYCQLPGRRQAFCITRHREVLRTGKATTVVAFGLTSLTRQQAGAEQVAHLVRGHWEIENRLHYPRDYSFDEDRCRVRVGNLPRNLATLSNLAISIIRLDGRFDHIPTAQRHFQARSQEALDLILNHIKPN